MRCCGPDDDKMDFSIQDFINAVGYWFMQEEHLKEDEQPDI